MTEAKLHPSITDVSKSLTARLESRAMRLELQRWMRSIGIKERGPANFPLVAEALSRDINISATRTGGIALDFEGDTFTWRSGRTSLNHPSARKLVPHKDVQSRVFRSAGLPFPENYVFSRDEEDRAWDWARHVLPVAIKPATGSKGRDVFLNIADRNEFSDAYTNVSRKWHSVLVEQFKSGSEHRMYVVDGEFIAALVMKPANVTGDGQRSIEELVATKNETALIPHRAIRLDTQELATLHAGGLSPESVLEEGRTIYLRQNSNLSTGGDSIDATDSIRPSEAHIAEKAAKAWPGTRAVGFDLVLPREAGDGPPSIVEANLSAGIGGHHHPRFGRAREVCVPILNAMFPQTSRLYATPPRQPSF